MMVEHDQFSGSDLNEDNMSALEVQGMARVYGMDIYVCKVCNRPCMWRKGSAYYNRAPATCGRNKCMLEYGEEGVK